MQSLAPKARLHELPQTSPIRQILNLACRQTLDPMSDVAVSTMLTIGAKDESGKTNYTEREAVRALVINAWGHIAVLYSRRDGYYKLPGGGVDPGEDHYAAVIREVKEETGAIVRISDVGCVAVVEEYRDDLHQFSYLYLACTVNDEGPPKMTDLEIQDDLIHWWSPPDDAIKAMEDVKPTTELGEFIKMRDVYLLREGLTAYKYKIAIPHSEASGYPVAEKHVKPPLSYDDFLEDLEE